MNGFTIEIDQVPVKDTDNGLELCEDNDPHATGLNSYAVDVEYDADGEWWITAVYRDTKPPSKLKGPHSLKVSSFLNSYSRLIVMVEDKIREVRWAA